MDKSVLIATSISCLFMIVGIILILIGQKVIATPDSNTSNLNSENIAGFVIAVVFFMCAACTLLLNLG